MKKIVFVLLSFLAMTAIKAQKLEVVGDIKNLPEGTIVSLFDGMANKVVDSIKIDGSKFKLSHKVVDPSIYILSFSTVQAKIPVFVGNDSFKITGDIQQPAAFEYKGSPSQEVYLNYLKVLNPKLESLFASKAQISNTTGLVKDSISREVTTKEADLTNAIIGLLKSNNKSPVSTLFLIQTTNFIPYVKDHIEELYALLDGAAKKGPFAELIDKSLMGRVGTVLPDFKQNDVNGSPVSLSSLRGKYVLIDFWASWCGPCRAENPNVVKAFNAYKAKGFTVLGVSLDQDKAKWLDAIKKDGLTWTHVSDLKYWSNEVAVKFQIQSIPANFLIDPKGVIIGKDLRGEELEKFLAANIK